jgi:hypothetical protein
VGQVREIFIGEGMGGSIAGGKTSEVLETSEVWLAELVVGRVCCGHQKIWDNAVNVVWP